MRLSPPTILHLPWSCHVAQPGRTHGEPPDKQAGLKLHPHPLASNCPCAHGCTRRLVSCGDSFAPDESLRRYGSPAVVRPGPAEPAACGSSADWEFAADLLCVFADSLIIPAGLGEPSPAVNGNAWSRLHAFCYPGINPGKTTARENHEESSSINSNG